MKRATKLRALVGLVAVIAVVVGILVWPTPKEARAESIHTVKVLHHNLTPWPAIAVTVYVQTGPDPEEPNDWSVDWAWTDGYGKVYIDLSEHTTAPQWFYTIGEGFFPDGENPLEGFIDYPTKSITRTSAEEI